MGPGFLLAVLRENYARVEKIRVFENGRWSCFQ